MPATFFVSLTGVDTNSGLAPDSAFRSLKRTFLAAEADTDPTTVIQVAAGTYAESGGASQTVQLNFRDNVQILGGFDPTFAMRTPRSSVFVFEGIRADRPGLRFVATDNLTIDGFVFVFDGQLGEGGSSTMEGIWAQGLNFRFTNNTVESPRDGLSASAPIVPEGRYGLQMVTNSDLNGCVISDNVFLANAARAQVPSHGVIVNRSRIEVTDPISIANNRFEGSNMDRGVVIDSTAHVNITGNTFGLGAPDAAGLIVVAYFGPADTPPANAVPAQTDITVEDNTFDAASATGSTVGIRIGGTLFPFRRVPPGYLSEVLIQNNQILNHAQGIFVTEAGDRSTIDGLTTVVGNTITGNNVGIALKASLARGRAIVLRNLITGNSVGVVVGESAAAATQHNQISENRIFANDGLGIDLGDDGVTLNDSSDPDVGPSALQNYPTLSGASRTAVFGSLNSLPNRDYVLEFFASAAIDGSGFGEGELFLGSTTVTTNGAGDAAFSAPLTTLIPAGYFVTATATDALTGDTSEFSASFDADADLMITKAGAPEQLFVGQELTYTIVVTNGGPNIATGVIVTDTLPVGATFVTAGTTQGTISESGGVVTGTLGELALGATTTLTIIVRPTTPGTLSNVASVAGEQPDPNPGNGTSAPAVTSVSAAPVEPSADLAAAKAVVPGSAVVGQPLTYTITASNLGPDADPSVVLADILPVGVTFVSSSIAPTTQTPGTLRFNLGSMAVGASVTVTVVVIPNVPGTITNQAIVEGAIPDPDPSNDLATVRTAVADAPPVTVQSLERFGFHRQPTILVLTFSAALNPATAQDVSNYLVELLGRNQRPVRTIRIGSATYDATAQAITLRFRKLLTVFARYRLTVNGSTPGGVTDATGRLIDGAGNGQPGSDYVRTFGRDILAGRNPSGTALAPTRSLRKPSVVTQREAVEAVGILDPAAIDQSLAHVNIRRIANRARRRT